MPSPCVVGVILKPWLFLFSHLLSCSGFFNLIFLYEYVCDICNKCLVIICFMVITPFLWGCSKESRWRDSPAESRPAAVLLWAGLLGQLLCASFPTQKLVVSKACPTVHFPLQHYPSVAGPMWQLSVPSAKPVPSVPFKHLSFSFSWCSSFMNNKSL